jgi:asparagine synthetase B (glutamine-hydrolysing)
MSDFLFHNKKQPKNKLSNLLKSIYPKNNFLTYEYHGDWGSLAVKKNHYNGFDPVETDNKIYFIIGGPVLTFTDNDFLTGNDSIAGTKKIIERFKSRDIRWDEDLSGPFIFGVLDKEESELQLITDIISFIPVFRYNNSDTVSLSTHPDILAKLVEEANNKDKVSIADFILNGIVTFPYTFYNSINQINPASIYSFDLNEGKNIKNHYYWRPTDEKIRTNLEETAKELRNDLISYINSVTSSMDKVAAFISGGEDSRFVLSMLPDELKKDGYIFLDEMNREGEFAQKAASAFDTNFEMIKRSKMHYLEILEGASKLTGSGSEYIHGHSFGMYKKADLNSYTGVFGGFFSDTFLKGLNIKKTKYTGKLPFVPEIRDSKFNEITKNKTNSIINKNIINKITQRRKEHFARIKKIRSTSLNEWFNLWPITMATETPNIHFNRKLFKSYEPFLSNKIVKMSASIPHEWKLNRKLFHKIVKPLFKECKNLKHASGWHPYYGWQVNSCLKIKNIMENKIKRRFNLDGKNQGPWGDWNLIMESEIWENKKEELYNSKGLLNDIFNNDLAKIFDSSKLSRLQKIDLLQASYLIKQF